MLAGPKSGLTALDFDAGRGGGLGGGPDLQRHRAGGVGIDDVNAHRLALPEDGALEWNSSSRGAKRRGDPEVEGGRTFPWIASLALVMTDTLPSSRRARSNLVCKIKGSELFVNWLVNRFRPHSEGAASGRSLRVTWPPPKGFTSVRGARRRLSPLRGWREAEHVAQDPGRPGGWTPDRRLINQPVAGRRRAQSAPVSRRQPCLWRAAGRARDRQRRSRRSRPGDGRQSRGGRGDASRRRSARPATSRTANIARRSSRS